MLLRLFLHSERSRQNIRKTNQNPYRQQTADSNTPDLSSKTDEEIFQWYLAQAEKGDANAQMVVSDYYSLGVVGDKNPEKAFYWIYKSASQGNPCGMISLGDMYFDGTGVKKDVYQSFAWYQKSADLGNPIAKTRLSVMFLDGVGVEQNYEEAERLFTESARQFQPEAMAYLGYIYGDGLGVNTDYYVSYKWYSLAYVIAKKEIERLNNMSSGTIADKKINEQAIIFLNDFLHISEQSKNNIEKKLTKNQLLEITDYVNSEIQRWKEKSESGELLQAPFFCNP